jgi:myosin heavy subunit
LTVDDVEEYNNVVNSFKTMNFSDGEQKGVWSLVAGSLLLGNVSFDGSTMDETKGVPCGIKDDKPLKVVADVLSVDYDALAKALRFKTRVSPGSVTESPVPESECQIFRDSLAKELYNRLFDWLVKKLNFTVVPNEFLGKGELKIDAITSDERYYHIGLLDIFGFEIL